MTRTTEDPLVCADCGFRFNRDEQKKKSKKDYVPMGRGLVCRDRRTCRARKLADDLELDLFSRRPREKLIEDMQIRPANWEKIGWKPIPHTEVDRVEAAIDYFSWCFPVCMLYAVQLDADDGIIMDAYGQPKPHTHRSLADFLGMAHQNVTRAIKWLERAKRVRQDDGRIYLEKQPHLTLEERKNFAADEEALGEERNTIPQKYRHQLARLIDDVGHAGIDPEGSICSDAMTRVLGYCTRYNDAHKEIRTERNTGIKEVCTQLATLLSRPLTSEGSPASDLLPRRDGTASAPRAERSPKKPPVRGGGQSADRPVESPAGPLDAETREAVDLLFAEIERMQAAYPHTDFSTEKVDPNRACDRVIVRRVVSLVGPRNVFAFCLEVAGKFKGLDVNSLAKLPARSPEMANGPRSLGLILEWAKDFAQRHGEQVSHA